MPSQKTGKPGKLSVRKCEAALAAVAAYLPNFDDDGKRIPCPTGPDAARAGLGPMLLMEWDWPSSGPTPTVILEGIGGEWAYNITSDVNFQRAMDQLGIFAEPYAGYALCLYPA